MIRNMILVLMLLLLTSCKLLPYKNFIIPQNSMYPNLPANTILIAKMRPYKTVDDIKHGDVIIYEKKQNGKIYDYIWRVVGLPGDTVTTHLDTLWVNDTLVPRKYKSNKGPYKIYTENRGAISYDIAVDTTLIPLYSKAQQFQKKTTVIPENHVFALGDSRIDAADSRFDGPIKFSVIFGKMSTVLKKGNGYKKFHSKKRK